MSLFHRIVLPGAESELGAAGDGRLPDPRQRYPHGVFAELETDPPEMADVAYAAFSEHALTPGVAERHVARVLAGCEAHCRTVESLPGFGDEIGREPIPAARARVFAHYLVQMQFQHEMNARLLLALRQARVTRRVRILPGCCAVCDATAKRTWRLSVAPPLPTRGCVRLGGCNCAYVPATR